MGVGVNSFAYRFSEGSPTCASFSSVFSYANDMDLSLFPGKQYILLVGLVNGKSFLQFVMSNRCSDVQKLFLVIRDGSSDIMYKISYKNAK